MSRTIPLSIPRLTLVFILALTAPAALAAESGGRVFTVLLKEPSVVEQVIATTDRLPLRLRREIALGAEGRQLRAELERRQSALVGRLRDQAGRMASRAPGLNPTPRFEVLARRAFLVNMLVVEGNREALEFLAAQPEVRGVFPTVARQPHLDAAATLVAAEGAWNALGGIGQAGAGIKIGIIDSGINIDHPMFDDAGISPPAGYPLPAENAAFTNGKVIVARNYVKPEYGYAPQTNQTPEDEAGHGTSVAGVAAGRRVSTPAATIQGIAPMAYLGSYRIFGDPNVNPSAWTPGIAAAVNDAVEDGMDVLNCSFGGFPPPEPLEQMVFANAVAMGVVVVASAGNSGPDLATVGCPSCLEEVIAAGASTNSRALRSAMRVQSPNPGLPAQLATVAYVSAQGLRVEDDFGPHPIAVPLPGAEEACSTLPPNSLRDRIALVRRGSCSFAQKGGNVAQAGALALLVFNNVDGGLVTMAGLAGYGRPAVMIGRGEGEALRDFLQSGNDASGTLLDEDQRLSFPGQPNQVTRFSSRGPGPEQRIKPDLSAPGQDIYTAENQTTPEARYRSVNGTSFSAPIVAGGAALVRQLHPDWTPAAIKSALVNTANRNLSWNGQSAASLHSGNGQLNLTAALAASAAIDPVSVNFGFAGDSRQDLLTRDLQITNLGDRARSFSLRFNHRPGSMPVTISAVPPSLNVAPGQSGVFRLTADLGSRPPAYGAFEGWVEISSADRMVALSALFRGGVAVETDEILAVSQSGAAAANASPALQNFPNLTAAVAAARPGNIIEIRDNSTYREAIVIGLTELGIPLSGLRLRAGQGLSPTLDNSGAGLPAIEVRQAERVTVEGLRVTGSDIGIQFSTAEGVVLNNLISVQRNPGIFSINSRLHVFGNTVRGGSRGVVAHNSSLLAQHNLFEDHLSAGVAVESLPGAGLSPLGLFENVIQNNSGQGVQVIDSPAIVKSNAILGNGSSVSGGVLVSGPGGDLLLQDSVIENNQAYGVRVSGGASARALRNRLVKNPGEGLSVSQAEARAHANWFVQNGTNVVLRNGVLDLSDSVVAQSAQGVADGLQALEGSHLRAANCLFFGNQNYGLNALSSTVAVFNSIFFQNVARDINGGFAADYQNNLIFGGQYNGLNGNFADPPAFVDPDALDFSLRPNSPAIDRGLPDQSLEAFDLQFHKRVVDGNQDGVATVDLGPVEFGSDHAPALILPVLSVDPAELVGLAMANAYTPAPQSMNGSAPSSGQVTLRAYDSTGARYAERTRTIPSGAQDSLILADVFSPLREGWVEILGVEPDLMAFTLLGDYSLRYLDGSELGAAVSEALVFPEVFNASGRNTRLLLVNPEETRRTIDFRWLRNDLQTATARRTIEARGSLSIRFSDLFGSGEGGYVSALTTDGRPIYGMQIFGGGDSKAGLLALNPARASNRLYSAQLASTPAIETTLNLINLGPAGEATLEALDESGQVIAEVRVPLAGGRQYRQAARQIFQLGSSSVVGWIRVSFSEEGLIGNVVFGDAAGNFLAALPLQSSGAREFILSHVAETPEIFTGVTLLNANPGHAVATVEVFDPAGDLTGRVFLELGPQQKQARLLSEWLPGLVQAGGFIRVRSNLPLLGFELFGNQTLSFLAAVPQQPVAQ